MPGEPHGRDAFPFPLGADVTCDRPVAGASIPDVLRHYWGFDTLRPLQEEAIRAGLDRRDSLVVMPTGGGKSLCYQVPPIVADRLDIVVSPLISLMKDQVDGLVACGYPAAALHSGLSAGERRAVLDALDGGDLRLLFVSPERLMIPGFLARLADLDVRAFAVDEAHCISHWGHDFRPEYRQLETLRDRFPGSSVHAFTATATPRVQTDIVEQLGLRDPRLLVGCFDRPNLTYRVVPRTDRRGQILEIVRRHPDEAVIVYCLSRRDTEDIAAALKSAGIEAAPYHAGLDATRRRRTQEAFSSERLDVVVATVAFGMGIDRSNVRCVVHAAMPKSIEHYQQETGRAGRDGLEAECVLLYSAADGLRWKGLIERDGPVMVDGVPEVEVGGAGAVEALAAQLELLRHMQGLCSTLECRHRALMRYFGQRYDEPSCGACDVCLDEVEVMPESTDVARKILSGVARLDQRYGVTHLVNVLRGADIEAVRRGGHDRLSTFGLLREIPAKSLTHLVYQLIDLTLLRQTPGDRPILQLTEEALPVLRGEREVKLLAPREGAKVKRSRSDAESWEGVDRVLFESLRELRARTAKEIGKPPYVVFGDASLREMAKLRPTTPERLREVYGVGEHKLTEYGPAFLEIIVRHEAPAAPSAAGDDEASSPA